jgi:quercetin dioxygenase-like cupin family protein
VQSRTKGRGVSIRALVPEPVPDEMMEVMDFAPAALMAGTPHLPGTREYFTCLDGCVNLMVAGERHELAQGDVLAFPGNLPHSYQNADALAPVFELRARDGSSSARRQQHFRICRIFGGRPIQ